MNFSVYADTITGIMETPTISYFTFLTLLSIMILFVANKETLAGRVPESSGKFMLVETPDNEKPSKYLVVENPNGRKSLIEMEEPSNYDYSENKEKGNKYLPN